MDHVTMQSFMARQRGLDFPAAIASFHVWFQASYRGPAVALAMIIVCLTAFATTGAVAAEEPLAPNAAAISRGAVVFKGVEVKGSNLTNEEVTKIFSHASTWDETEAIFAKLTAASISIAEITVTSKDRTFKVRDVRATDIKDRRAARLSIGGLEGATDIPGAGQATLKIEAVTIENGNFLKVLNGLTSGHVTSGYFDAQHIVLSGIAVMAPEPLTSRNRPDGNLYRIKLATLEIKTTYDNAVLKSFAATLKDLKIELPWASNFRALLGLYGYDRIELDAKISGNYDAVSKAYALDNFTINAVNAGTIKVEARLGNIDQTLFTGDKDAKAKAAADGNISHFSLQLTNSGYFEKSLSVVAARRKMTAQQLQTEWNSAAQKLVPVKAGADSSGQKIDDAVSAFVSNPKSLTITANAKSGSVKISDLNQAKTVEGLLTLFNIDAVAGK